MILDTTILIDFLRGKENAVAAINKLRSNPIYTTEINLFELVTGAYLTSNTESQLEKINALLSKIVVLQLDRKATMKAGEIAGKLRKQGKQIEEIDCLIAGIALANNINAIITENKAHFERIQGVKVIGY